MAAVDKSNLKNLKVPRKRTLLIYCVTINFITITLIHLIFASNLFQDLDSLLIYKIPLILFSCIFALISWYSVYFSALPESGFFKRYYPFIPASYLSISELINLIYLFSTGILFDNIFLAVRSNRLVLLSFFPIQSLLLVVPLIFFYQLHNKKIILIESNKLSKESKIAKENSDYSEYNNSIIGDEEFKTIYLSKSQANETPSDLLGKSAKNSAKVIRSILSRSRNAERVSNYSMVTMMVLVIVGGSSSFGFWVKDRIEAMRNLESVRTKLVDLSNNLNFNSIKNQYPSLFLDNDQAKKIANETVSSLKAKIEDSFKKGQSDVTDTLEPLGKELISIHSSEQQVLKLSQALENIQKNISDSYSEKEQYAKAIDDAEKLSESSWADIAARGTIALLTLFLIQIFYSVYKYNRQLYSSLSSKAEAIELISDDDENKKMLNTELLHSVREHLPGFGPTPKTPIQEALGLAERLKDKVGK